MRVFQLALVAAVFSASGVIAAPGPAALHADDGAIEITDLRLLGELAGLRSMRAQSASTATVTVEVLTTDDVGISAAINRLGGHVTGSVAGQIVQADVPVGQLTTLANTTGATLVRAPRAAGYISPDSRRAEAAPGTGVAGDEVNITNAAAWHNAGFTGAGVRVGIIDYFNFAVWNTSENGPLPTSANGHTFCRDGTNSGLCNDGTIASYPNGGEHGVAVAEIVKDMAPGSDVYVATVGTVADLQAAVNWFASNGVSILTRSLGSAYDGPGDGTGPLAAVADSAAAQGMVWFNSAGNDAVDGYMRRSVPSNLAARGYVDFSRDGSGDTWLRLDGGSSGGVLFDGIRWSNDWYLPAAERTDYSLEFWEPKTTAHQFDDSYNPVSTSELYPIDLDANLAGIQNVYDANQRGGAAPLEAEDLFVYPVNIFGEYSGIVYMRMRRNAATPVGATPDQLEIALGDGLLEPDYYDTPGSASKPVVDSKNPSVIAVGAVDPPAGSAIGYYSSQGPTFDGRIKPDLSAPAGFASVAYHGLFQGTSAASPVAAGTAALLLGANLAVPGRTLAALVRHFTVDLGTVGKDNVYGAGKVLLPAPPAPLAATPGRYIALTNPSRVFDSRSMAAAGLGVGPYPQFSIVDVDVLSGLAVAPASVSAVAVNITSTRSGATGFIQASPYLAAATGATSTLNVSTAGADRPNFAIVPVGQGGKISLYLDVGGDVIVDVLGYFQTGTATATAGRFVSIPPERWMDSRNDGLLPTGSGSPALVAAGGTATSVRLPSTVVPASGVSALVINVTATDATAPGYMVAMRSGGNPAGTQHSTVNFTPVAPAANSAIVPVGPDGSVAVYTTAATNILIDVVGYITDATASNTTTGMFQPVTPSRPYDSRALTPFSQGESRTIALNTVPGVAADASAVSSNLTVTAPTATGFLTVYPATPPATSNLNFGIGHTVANGALLRLSPSGTVTARMSEAGHLLIDVNGFFLS